MIREGDGEVEKFWMVKHGVVGKTVRPMKRWKASDQEAFKVVMKVEDVGGETRATLLREFEASGLIMVLPFIDLWSSSEGERTVRVFLP